MQPRYAAQDKLSGGVKITLLDGEYGLSIVPLAITTSANTKCNFHHGILPTSLPELIKFLAVEFVCTSVVRPKP